MSDVRSRIRLLLCVSVGALGACSGEADTTPERVLAAAEYVDPKGFFSLTPPHEWRLQEYPDDPRGKVAFLRSRGTDLRVLTNAVDYSDIGALERELRATVARLGIQTNLERTVFNGTEAMERDFVLRGSRILMIDFLEGNVAHNLMFTAPQREFENYLDIVQASLATYQPIDRELSAEEITENTLAKARRLGRLLIDQGSYEEAGAYIEGGLAESGTDSLLLQLQAELRAKTGS